MVTYTMGHSKINIEQNLLHVREEIAHAARKAGRKGEEIRLVAVTKSAEPEDIQSLVCLGVHDLGESRVQQLLDRANDLHRSMGDPGSPILQGLGEVISGEQKPSTGSTKPTGGVRWHMVGHLQRNKVRPVLEVVGVVHTLDSLRLAEEINARAEKMGKIMEVLMQVNCSQETQKFGVAVGAAFHLAELVSTMKNLRLMGLMTMGPLEGGAEAARPAFARLRELFEEMRHEDIARGSFRHLSMGMSRDYQIAIEEGATIVRIGSALFE